MTDTNTPALPDVLAAAAAKARALAGTVEEASEMAEQFEPGAAQLRGRAEAMQALAATRTRLDALHTRLDGALQVLEAADDELAGLADDLADVGRKVAAIGIEGDGEPAPEPEPEPEPEQPARRYLPVRLRYGNRSILPVAADFEAQAGLNQVLIVDAQEMTHWSSTIARSGDGRTLTYRRGSDRKTQAKIDAFWCLLQLPGGKRHAISVELN